MRVISGKAKGRKLKSVRGPGTRPVTDRAKTAFFDILGHSVARSHFLDLFAGTGQVGIEALSRDAERVVFVEQGYLPLKIIGENLRLTGLEEHAQVLRADVFAFLRRPTEAFHYIYIAPPQYRGLWKQALLMVDLQPEWLTPEGWVVVQIHPQEYEELKLQQLELFDQRKYGSVMFCFYRVSRGGEESSSRIVG